ncbi:TPA: pyruvate kinase [Mannheimia haemolytica]
MKEFDLKKALAGEPVRLRGGRKAYVKYSLRAEKVEFGLYSELHGYVLNEYNQFLYAGSWAKEGKYCDYNSEDDIIGMWEEPLPRVQLELPCPLKEWVEGCYLIDDDFKIKRSTNGWYRKLLEEGRYFATEEDAQAWLDAMRNSRRREMSTENNGWISIEDKLPTLETDVLRTAIDAAMKEMIGLNHEKTV